ncbi:MAG: RNA polymerase sigma factor [Deltaproteobacteria bacterium]|nr:RNA polymerase sigma factor [Deltaproteobacteria bacterium]
MTPTTPTPAEVVREHGPAVLSRLRRMFGVHAEIDDTFQQVMLEVVRGLPAFAGRSELSTWIHRITLNVAYQRMRRSYRAAGVVALDSVTEPQSDDADALTLLERAESARLLHACLEMLPPKRRVAVVLHDIEGLTLKAIGEHIGSPLQTVASQLKAGRAELAAHMQRALRDRPVIKQRATANGSTSTSTASVLHDANQGQKP